MTLSHLSYKIRLQSPASRVWRLITDTHTWTQWGPSVQQVDCSERFIRSGTSGRIRTPLGFWVPFRVQDFEPEIYWNWKVGGVTATGHRVENRGPDQSDLYFSVPIWAAPYGMVFKAALVRIEKLLATS